MRFGELNEMEWIAAFVSNPFILIDIKQVAAKFQKAFSLSSGFDMEMFDLQNDIELKARSRDSDFWGLVKGLLGVHSTRKKKKNISGLNKINT